MTESGGRSILRLDGVVRRFGSVTAVDRLSLSLDPGEFLTLLGPSGCGKTTALRLIAGFESPDEGSLRFEGRDVTAWSPQRRGFGMVFQNYALFPHLNVFENVAFGLRARRWEAERIRERVGTALEVVDLSGYAERAVQGLSGGQQQRVALARALAIEPPLLLLDEPLSNLDQALRVRTRTELRSLVKTLGITALFVTHDQEEAFDLSDRIAVMREGRLRQIGTPRELYEAPADAFVAGFVGRANRFPVVVRQGRLQVAEGIHWLLGGDVGKPARMEEGPALLVVRPEDLEMEGPGADREGALPGRVAAIRFRGAMTYYEVEVDAALPGMARRGTHVEVAAEPGRAGVGGEVALRPRPGARLHLYPPSEHARGEG